MEKSLRIPYAIVEGNKIKPENARKGVEYFCPECNEKLIFRSGQKMRKHFAHHSSNCAFMNEGWAHLSAKYQIRYWIEEWIAGNAKAPRLIRECSICKERTEQDIPRSVKQIEFEKTIDSFRVDIALCDEFGNILCGIEVKNTHAIDDRKREISKHPWIEVSAEQILMEDSSCLHVLQEENLNPYFCKCWKGVNMKVVQRGLATHVDGCPISARVWKGKSYANFIDDCAYCENLVAHLQDHQYNSYVFCSAGNIKPNPERKKQIIDLERQISAEIKKMMES